MPTTRRWTIGRRFLTPVLGIVAAALFISSGLSAWWSAAVERKQEEDRLARVVQTLTARGFPLTEAVLERMRGLSGAEFVVTDGRGEVSASTMALASADRAAIVRWLRAFDDASATDQSPLSLAERAFLAQRVPLDASAMDSDSSWLIVLSRQQGWWHANRQAILPPLVVGLGACVVLIAAITLIARRLARPIRALGRHASLVAGGEFQPLALETGTLELQELVRALNHMVERLARYEEQVRRHERLRTLGQLSGGIAHQLRNAATGARMALDLHCRECPAPDDEALEVAGRQLALMESYLQRFLTLGRAPLPEQESGPREPVSLPELAESVVELVNPICRHAGVVLECLCDGPTPVVLGHRHALEQLLMNLVLNGIEAARHPNVRERRVSIRLSMEGDRAMLAVVDTGPGPAAHVSGRIFEPFVTEKAEGAGLGLSMAQEIAVAHGGEIAWHRTPRASGDLATCFEVRLPLMNEAIHGAAAGCR